MAHCAVLSLPSCSEDWVTAETNGFLNFGLPVVSFLTLFLPLSNPHILGHEKLRKRRTVDIVRTLLLVGSSPTLVAFGVLAASLYCPVVAIYRLFLHPIAYFPGPRVAGLTRWYEFYHEIVQKGQMTFHIQDLHRTISALGEDHDETNKTVDHATLFHEMLNSDLTPKEKSVNRVVQEAQVIIGAAMLTTSWAAAVASFHIIDKPEIFKKLRAELEQAIPDLATQLDWQTLEPLPYLTGCIKEGVRLAYGIASRLPRVARQDLKYRDWTIPAGTLVSMTIVDMNHDEEIFPQSRSFAPERWLTIRLQRMVSRSKDTLSASVKAPGNVPV